MNNLPEFDEVHVVSDLHMGGKPGFQILRETQRLANFILRLAAQRPKGRLALVLNGDVFDTLAEDLGGFVAVDDAPVVVQRIMDDASFAAIWDAMATFVKTSGRTLVFVIGNHDIEIAFPTVQRLLRSCCWCGRFAGIDQVIAIVRDGSVAEVGSIAQCTVQAAAIQVDAIAGDTDAVAVVTPCSNGVAEYQCRAATA